MTGASRSSTQQKPPSRRRETALLVAAAVLAVAGASLSSRRVWRRSRSIDSPGVRFGSATVSAAATAFAVASATGTVEAQREGRWIPIHPGDTLTRTDVIRTATGSHAVLRLDAGTEIELRERVEIGLDRLPGGPTVDLRRGKLEARVRGQDALAITSRDTRTANEGPAHFVVRSDEQGRVSVAALAGTARFEAGGQTVKLTEGTESTSQSGAAPSSPERIPEAVLLDVVWPEAEQRHGAEHAEIQGRTSRSATVHVNGAEAAVGADGRFTATLPLHEGENDVDVAVEDIRGNTRQASTTIVRRPARPPALTAEPTDLWKK
jgi:glucodextranase-like protein/FecR-like protein